MLIVWIKTYLLSSILAKVCNELQYIQFVYYYELFQRLSVGKLPSRKSTKTPWGLCKVETSLLWFPFLGKLHTSGLNWFVIWNHCVKRRNTKEFQENNSSCLSFILPQWEKSNLLSVWPKSLLRVLPRGVVMPLCRHWSKFRELGSLLNLQSS